MLATLRGVLLAPSCATGSWRRRAVLIYENLSSPLTPPLREILQRINWATTIQWPPGTGDHRFNAG